MAESSSYTAVQRDGTSQAHRVSAALDPASIPLDERNMADWIRFAQAFAKQLNFFSPDKGASDSWENFLGDGTATGNEQFILDLTAYINNPGSFANSPAKLHTLTRPHLALFVSFLQLLGHVKTQLNGFTQKHLDFYYYDVLGLREKKPVPDVVNLVAALADDVKGFLLRKDTELFAGKDSQGEDLIYKTEKDTVINRASVQAIRTLYSGKKTLTIQQVRKNDPEKDKGLLEIWQLALNTTGNNDKLPAYKEGHEGFDIETLTGLLYRDLDNEATAAGALLYINENLLVFKEEFKNIILIFEKRADAQWQIIDYILKKVYRRKLLKQIREKQDIPSTGFLKMLEWALGEPMQGNSLPPYNGSPADIEKLTSDLEGNAGSQSKATAYINKALHLTESSFKQAVNTRSKPKIDSAAWLAVYADIENALVKKRGSDVPEPVQELWEKPVAVNDARAKAKAASPNHQFNTFGRYGATDASYKQGVNIGFAITSPLLELQEGVRAITLTISFRDDKPVSALPGSFQPFACFLSSGKGWLDLQPRMLRSNFGNFISGGHGAPYTATCNDSDKSITKTAGDDFTALDTGKYMLWTDGSLYLISQVNTAQQVTVTFRGKVIPGLPADGEKAADPLPVAMKYDAASVHLNAMQLCFTLPETDPPVTAPAGDDDGAAIHSSYPVLSMLLQQAGAGESNSYPLVKDFQLQKVHVQAKVKKIKKLVLQNDDAVISYKKPFEPFGYYPEAGSHLYFTHPELCNKRLNGLSLQFRWMNVPASLKDYYADYFKVRNYKKGDKEEARTEITGNDQFTATLALVDHDATTDLNKAVTLFPATASAEQVVFPATGTAPIAPPAQSGDAGEQDEEVLNRKRHFSLTLNDPDFQHSLYPVLLTKQLFIKADKAPEAIALHDLPPLNPPYTPKLASFTIGYEASTEISAVAGTTEPGGIYHITAFGYRKLDITAKDGPVYFIPHFDNTGELYIGIADFFVPQTLSLFFKLADGSADPDAAKVQVRWHYLSNNTWNELAGTTIVSDTTNGLLNTGIVELAVPQDATCGSTLFPEPLYWLRASVAGNTDAVADTVDVFAQGVSAVFTDHNNAADHFLYLLAPGSIQEPVVKIPELKKMVQPYPSSKGKPAETANQFTMRASERLRHKGRALAMWDYERLILERFPDIYKVKCIPAAVPGGVDIIVIPNIRGKFPFNPFEPKVAADDIYSIKNFIEQRMPAWAAVTVKNASYVQVKARIAVRIREGYNESFFIARLQEELVRYLAPWAYDDGADIFLNGRIDADMIVNFAAEKPYVDHVAGVTLFRLAGHNAPESAAPVNGENFIQAVSPDEVLASAPMHQIDLLRDELYQNDFKGIGYMRIELDFKIAAGEKDNKGIGYMRIETDFRIA